jgi:hypothetical protein
MINNRVLYGALSCILIVQTGCLQNRINNESDPIEMTSLRTEPVACEDDPLDFYNAMPVLDDMDTSEKPDHTLPVDKLRQDCMKLRKAIQLSIPGSKKQNDEKALILLNELTKNSTLVGRDLKFSMLLLQHVSQREQLRKIIETQKKSHIKSEQKITALKSQLEILQSQLDQLKNIEIEIGKKERSVISPIGE